jgi:hypothetical protein
MADTPIREREIGPPTERRHRGAEQRCRHGGERASDSEVTRHLNTAGRPTSMATRTVAALATLQRTPDGHPASYRSS